MCPRRETNANPTRDPWPPWWLWLLGANALFVFSTFYRTAQLPGDSLLRPLNLAREHTVATWFSGIQLLLFALLAHSLSLALRARDRRAGRAYWLLSWIGLLLFWDEIGSIHERAEFFMPLPDDVAELPLGIVGGVVLLYALVLMRRSRTVTGNSAWLVVAGFLAFAMVYLLEIVEGLQLSRLVRALRFAVEEGTELLGILLLHAAIVSNKKRLGAFTGKLRDFLPGRQTLRWFARLCLVLSVPVLVLRAQFTAADLVIPRRGDFSAAIPILLYALAALMAFELGLRARADAWRWWLLAGVLLALSIDAEFHLHRLVEYGRRAGQLRNDLALLWALPVLTAALFAIPALRKSWVLLAAGGLFALAVASTGHPPDALTVIALPYLTSFGVFFLISWHAGPTTATETL
jgi:hypothetical protein